MELIVVGAGPAGCAAAQRLRRLGHSVLVLEAAEEIGGRARTLREGSYAAEAGGDTLLSLYSATRRLVQEIGLGGSLRSFERAAAIHDGNRAYRLRAGSPLSYATTPLLSIGEKARLALGFVRASLAPPIDLFDEAEPPRSLDGCSVAAWAAANLGEKALAYLIRPAIESRWYFSCEELPVSYGLELIRRAPLVRFYCVSGGMSALLARMLDGARLETAIAVELVEPHAAGVRVHATGGVLDADGVLIAADAPAAAALLPPSAPARTVLARCRYSSNVRLLVGYGEDAWRTHPIASVNPVTPASSAVATVSLVSRKSADLVPEGREVVAVHLTGQASARLGDAEAREVAHEAIRRFLPPAGQQPVFERLVRWRRALPIPRPSQLGDVHRARATLPPRLALAGDYFGLPTIETAVRSGHRAADRLHASLASSA